MLYAELLNIYIFKTEG